MKTNLKIVIKLIALSAFLFATPFFGSIKDKLSKNEVLTSLVYHQRTLSEPKSIKDQLNVITKNSTVNIPNETDQEKEYKTTQDQDAPVVPETPKPSDSDKKEKKRIYIYNTHQQEGYQGGKTVMDGAQVLAEKLQKAGIDVVVETNDFVAYGRSQGWDYNSSYAVSNKFINDAFANYGGFDLVIDLHRDSVPREACFAEINGKSYARVMTVIGGLSKNVSASTKIAATLTDIINQDVNGIMKTPMTREAYYNQQMSPNMILIEVGADQNTFEEVTNSLDVLAKAIEKMMG